MSKYLLENLPATASNGARILDCFKDGRHTIWKLECQSCLTQWTTRADKAGTRDDARFCPSCARSAKSRLRHPHATPGETPYMLARKEKRIAKAVAILEADGYCIKKP